MSDTNPSYWLRYSSADRMLHMGASNGAELEPIEMAQIFDLASGNRALAALIDRLVYYSNEQISFTKGYFGDKMIVVSDKGRQIDSINMYDEVEKIYDLNMRDKFVRVQSVILSKETEAREPDPASKQKKQASAEKVA